MSLISDQENNVGNFFYYCRAVAGFATAAQQFVLPGFDDQNSNISHLLTETSNINISGVHIYATGKILREWM